MNQINREKDEKEQPDFRVEVTLGNPEDLVIPDFEVIDVEGCLSSSGTPSY